MSRIKKGKCGKCGITGSLVKRTNYAFGKGKKDKLGKPKRGQGITTTMCRNCQASQ